MARGIIAILNPWILVYMKHLQSSKGNLRKFVLNGVYSLAVIEINMRFLTYRVRTGAREIIPAHAVLYPVWEASWLQNGSSTGPKKF